MTRDILRHTRLLPIRNSAVLFILLAAILVSAAPVGAAGRVDLSLGFGACHMLSYGPSGWATGFEAGGYFALWRKAGIHVGVGLLKGSRKDFWDSGLDRIVDAGFWKSFGSESTPSIFFLGASLSWPNNVYEVDIGGYGVHLGFRQEFWFAKNVGVYGGGVVRVFLAKDSELASFAPAFSGGLCFRF